MPDIPASLHLNSLLGRIHGILPETGSGLVVEGSISPEGVESE
jgi:hypothetical protein